MAVARRFALIPTTGKKEWTPVRSDFDLARAHRYAMAIRRQPEELC